MLTLESDGVTSVDGDRAGLAGGVREVELVATELGVGDRRDLRASMLLQAAMTRGAKLTGPLE